MNILYSQDARESLLFGIDTIANTIKGTLGPVGRNVALHQKANVRDAQYADNPMSGAHILITNDGVTAAQSIVLADPIQDMGARMIKDAADKTNEQAGDGTTTAILLTQIMLHHLNRLVIAGANPLMLRKGMKKAAEQVLKHLKKSAMPVRNTEEITAVAYISCQEKELGQIIAEAFDKVGLEGMITLEDSGRFETTMDVQEGAVFDRGYIDSAMCTDTRQMIAELHDPYILLCDTKFTDYQDLLPFLILAAEDERPCLIISEGVEGSALGLINKNRIEGDMQIVCVNAPEYGEGRRWRMEDLALQTGGIYICKEFLLNIRDVSRDMLGTAGYVKITRKQTMIMNPGGDPEKISQRIKELRFLSQNTDYDFNRERYKERLAKFVSGVAKIHVGGQTEPEIWERKMRLEDAVNSARAAIEEGIVPGGGIALLNIAPKIKEFAQKLDEDEYLGAMTIYHALKAPASQILDNAGLDGKFLTETLLAHVPGTGYNVHTGQMVNMIDNGIIDPVKVTRLAFETAVSVAGTIATAEAAVPAKKQQEV